jgi:hypothetical protein
MRRIIAFLVGLALLGPLAGGQLLANGISAERYYRERQKERMMAEEKVAKALKAEPRKTESLLGAIPLYSYAAGAAAVAMTGSLVALRVIRKRNGK